MNESLEPVGQPERTEPPAREPVPVPDERLVSLCAPTSFEAEQYRILRHTVEQQYKERGQRVFAVTSPGSGDGKTTTAINLAAALAQGPDARILLIEADLRRPSIVQRLGEAPDGPGLVEAILGPSLSLADVVRVRARFNLALLPAGKPTAVPYELLKSARLDNLIGEARCRYDYVILDTPPAVPCPDYRVIERLLDGVLVVVAAHRTPQKMVEAVLSLVDPAKIVGVVFNGDDTLKAKYHYASFAEDKPRKGRMLRWKRGD